MSRLKITTVAVPGFTSYARKIGGKRDVAFPGYAWIVYRKETEDDPIVPLSGYHERVEDAYAALERLETEERGK